VKTDFLTNSFKTSVMSFLFVSMTTGCSLFSSRADVAETSAAPSTPAPLVQPAAPTTADAPTEDAHRQDETKPMEMPMHSMAHMPMMKSHSAPEGVASEKALGWLKNGNLRYRKGSLRKDGQSKKDIQRLATGQTPHTIVLSCSDSRVPPEVVFDQKLGEIFVIRTAGEALADNVIASIEYAVEHLGTRLIVVMGHTACGAVTAALKTMDGADAGSPALNNLVRDIHPRIASYKGKSPSKNIEEESWSNTRGVAKDLMERSHMLHEKVEAGELEIKTALYHLDDGRVDFTP